MLAIDEVEPGSARPAPQRLWDAIEEKAAERPVRQSSGWLLRAAAVAVLGLALAFTVVPRIDNESVATAVRAGAGEIEVELGSRSGEMTEERFLEIATEVLESDSRYQRAMLKVMDSVVDTLPATEGGDDALRATREGGRGEESTGGRA